MIWDRFIQNEPCICVCITARCNEPALQHRRRPPTLASSADKPELLAGGEGPAQDDYILLGDQAKFANSVRYRTKKSGQERFVQRAYPPVSIGSWLRISKQDTIFSLLEVLGSETLKLDAIGVHPYLFIRLRCDDKKKY